MRILVIDDQPRNIASARETLKGHEVITIDTIAEAFRVLKEGRVHGVDAVLTDLFMPLGGFQGAMSSPESDPSLPLPAGLAFALRTVNLGIRTVILSDSDHHRDWICSLLDLIRTPDPSNKVTFVEARFASVAGDGPLVKDWAKSMRRSLMFPDLPI